MRFEIAGIVTLHSAPWGQGCRVRVSLLNPYGSPVAPAGISVEQSDWYGVHDNSDPPFSRYPKRARMELASGLPEYVRDIGTNVVLSTLSGLGIGVKRTAIHSLRTPSSQS